MANFTEKPQIISKEFRDAKKGIFYIMSYKR